MVKLDDDWLEREMQAAKEKFEAMPKWKQDYYIRVLGP